MNCPACGSVMTEIAVSDVKKGCSTSSRTPRSRWTRTSARAWRSLRREQRDELLRQLGPDHRLLVLEENERVLPPLPQLLHRLGPLLEILLLVAFVAQPHVAEVGGRDERSMPRLRVRDTQRRVADPQRRVHVVHEP